jgi:hypothetical protein
MAMTTGFPVLKHQPSDFIVREVLLQQACDPAQATHQYYILAKSGSTDVSVGVVSCGSAG